MKKIFVEGHRGYAAKYPENTMLSFEAAMELGVDAIEFDVWLSAEKVPVIIHDGNCKRTCGVDAHVNNMTVAEIKALSAHYAEKFGDQYADMHVTIPTLEELLILRKAKRPDLWLGVEIKEYTEECVDKTVALLKKYGVFNMCFFYAFDAKIIKYLYTQYDARTMGYPDFQMRNYQPDSYSYYKELGLDLKYVRSEIFPIYQAKKLPIHMYCADNAEAVKLCIEMGADLITANDPVPLMTALGRM